MKRLLFNLLLITVASGSTVLLADDAETLNGKWSVKKVTDEGRNIIQTLEIKKDKFTFQILTSDNNVVIHAEGDFKLEDLGPFKSARFFNIRGGESPSNLEAVEDERVCIYMLDDDTWTIATNFDKARREKPSADAYHRVKSATKAASKEGTLIIDEIEMADTPQTAIWYLCLDATVGGVKKQHYLPEKQYDKNKLTIPVGLEFPRTGAGQKCSFRLQLDDVVEDTCGDEPDQRDTGEFTASEKGSQTYKPMENWHYTIRWHLK